MKTKKLPQNFNIQIAELTPVAQKELKKLLSALRANGFGGSIAKAVRVALDQWARECGGDGVISGGRRDGVRS